jgi:hypothetical protein
MRAENSQGTGTPLVLEIKSVLRESHILVLATQVLLGFQLHGVFAPGFLRLRDSSQHLAWVSLVLLFVALALLVAPASFHRLAARGADTPPVHRFAHRVLTVALLPLAIALGLDSYLVGDTLRSRLAGWILGGGITVAALASWYGVELVMRDRSRGARAAPRRDQEPESDLHDRVGHVLTEARLVLPGTQTLLGFQLTVMLLDEFDRLPQSSKDVHLVSFGLLALSTILLVMPSAFHRIVEGGRDTERFHRFAGAALIAAMAALGLGLSGDLYVVTFEVLRTRGVAVAAALAALCLFGGLWFLLPALSRERVARRGRA